MLNVDVMKLCREWHALFGTPRPDTDEAASAVCERLSAIEEALAGATPASIGAATAMLRVVLTYEDDLGSGNWDLAILRAVAVGLEQMEAEPHATPG